MSPNPSTNHEKVEFQAPESLIDDLDRVAYEQSSPKTTVNRSDVLREAARELVERHDEDPENVSPKERGRLNGAEQ